MSNIVSEVDRWLCLVYITQGKMRWRDARANLRENYLLRSYTLEPYLFFSLVTILISEIVRTGLHRCMCKLLHSKERQSQINTH